MSLTSAKYRNGIVSKTHEICSIQYNLNGSNTDGSFTMANSNSFLSPYEIFPIGRENQLNI